MAIAAALSCASADSAARRPHRLPLSRPGVTTFRMTLDLDPATEARLRRQLARGPYTEPSALIAHLLELAEETEQSTEDWLVRNRDAIRADLDESFAEEARGESYSPEESRAFLAERRAARSA